MKTHLSRRQFLGTALAGSTVYSLLPYASLGANNRVNIGVIGCGGKGGAHIKHFNGMADVRVIAVSDADADRMAKGENVARHQDLRNLLEMKELDAVVIATPNHWHALATVWACQAGKHVYVEKPVSHCIWEGRKMVEAARRYERIVQGGTQQASCPGLQACVADLQSGKYGKILWAHCSKLGSRGPIGKVDGPTNVPASVDYNLWAGPAPASPVMRRQFHYDWHWQWNWGDGEMGNWGPHYVNDLIRLLGWNDAPTNVVAAGNRWWDDDGETPNMHFCLMQHHGVNVVIDIRNLPDPATGGSGGAVYLHSRQGNHIQCENGYVKIARGGGNGYDNDGKRIHQYKGNGGSGHAANFIQAVRAGNNRSLNSEVATNHLGSTICHQANIGFRVGRAVSPDEIRAAMKDHEDATQTLTSMLAQLEGNQIDLDKKPFLMGPKLVFDPRTESFVGEHAEAANQYVRLPYRAPFDMPTW